jgi:regulator of protease activity HflC (stomatin/prohibitin superfamily)
MLFKELPDMEGVEMKLSELHYIQLLDEARQEILTKGNNTVHYLKEIESRLSDGEEAVKKVDGLEKEVERLKADNERLEIYNKKLLYENVNLFNERNILNKYKRELVEACEKHQESCRGWYGFGDDILSVMIAKHKEAL